MIKNDFPIFSNNSGLVYLDSAATVQKSKKVIDGISSYLENDYANIHRGQYLLSQNSEELFWEARKTISKWMNVESEEIIFTGNATGASNLLTQSLFFSGIISSDDTIMITEGEHHANIVPWQIIAKRIGCSIVWIPLLEDGSVDVKWIAQNIDSTVRIIAITAVSNVTGTINNIQEIKAVIDDLTYLVVDASQAIPHIPVLPNTRGCDFCWWTGHKIGAFPGVGVLWGKKELLKSMKSPIGGGGSIEFVNKKGYGLLGSPDKFEPGTPNLTGVLSIKLAMDYLSEKAEVINMSVYEMIDHIEKPLLEYCLEQFSTFEKQGVRLLGRKTMDGRVGVFSFILPEGLGVTSFGQKMANNDICIRCGGQCAHLYHASLGETGSCRMSLWVYNDLEDCEKFFEVMKTLLE